jgi:predicted transcriptional regulator
MKLKLATVIGTNRKYALQFRHLEVLLALEHVMLRAPNGVTIFALTKLLDFEKSDNAIKLTLGQLRRMGLVERVTRTADGQAIRTQGQGARGMYRPSDRARVDLALGVE